MKLSSQILLSIALGAAAVELGEEPALAPGIAIAQFVGITPHSFLSLLVMPINALIYSAAAFVLLRLLMRFLPKR